jgi:hypothetical protein
MAGKAKEYRALVGMNYPHPDDKESEVRVEAGDKISVIPDDDWVKHHMRVHNIEEWKERDTSKVRKPESEVLSVDGVMSRHANDGADIVLKGVTE